MLFSCLAQEYHLSQQLSNYRLLTPFLSVLLHLTMSSVGDVEMWLLRLSDNTPQNPWTFLNGVFKINTVLEKQYLMSCKNKITVTLLKL